jgi:hypothetical protein
MTVSPWGPAQPAMTAATAATPRTIQEVVEQLDEVQRAVDQLPPLFGDNPVADFNNLYRDITRRIDRRHRAGGFRDPAFLDLLDAKFAGRYLDALRSWGAADPTTPDAWAVLFRRYDDGRLRSLPCAAAGVNAHINYDLPFALLATWQQLGYPADNSPQHQDYLAINEIFADAIPRLRRGFLNNLQILLDKMNGKVDDWCQKHLVIMTRAHAWQEARQLWPLRDSPIELMLAEMDLDRHAAAWSRFLLSRICGPLQ